MASRTGTPVLSPAERGPTLDTLKTATCEQTIWQPRPAVLFVEQKGHLDVEVVQALTRAGEQILARGIRPSAFVDAEAVTGYTSAHRAAMTEWMKVELPSLGEVHTLTQSKLLAMGIAVANIVLRGKIVAHTHREPFERALRAALRGGYAGE